MNLVKMVKAGIVSQVNATCVEAHERAGWVVTDRDHINAPDAAQDDPVESDIKALRAEYEKAAGKRPFMGWTADALQEKITELASV